MKPFVYRFERKLGLVRQEEQAVRQELHLLMMERDRIVEELDHLQLRIHGLEEIIRNYQGNWLVPEAGLCKEYLPIVKEHFLHKTDELLQAEERVEEARNRAIEKKRETKTYEKLRENDWQDYRYELNREEQKEIDELAMAAEIRNVSRKGTGS